MHRARKPTRPDSRKSAQARLLGVLLIITGMSLAGAFAIGQFIDDNPAHNYFGPIYLNAVLAFIGFLMILRARRNGG